MLPILQSANVLIKSDGKKMPAALPSSGGGHRGLPLHSGSIIKTFTKQRCIRLPLLWAAPGPSRGRGCCGRGRGVPSSTRTRKSVKSTLNTVFGTMGKKLLAQGHGLLYSMGGGERLLSHCLRVVGGQGRWMQKLLQYFMVERTG